MKRRDVLAVTAGIPAVTLPGVPWETGTGAGDGENELQLEAEDPVMEIEIIEGDDAFEGSTVTVHVRVTNPSETTRRELVTVDRDGRETLFNEIITVDGNTARDVTFEWRVRHDAAGHTMQLNAETPTDADEYVVSGRAPFTPTVTAVTEDVTTSTVTVEYAVRNAGSAPNAHDITVRVDGDVVDEQSVWLPIDGEESFTVRAPVTAGTHEISLETESTTVTRMFTALQ